MESALIGAIIKAVLQTFAGALTDMFKTWRTEQEARDAGTLEQQGKDEEAARQVQADLLDELGRQPTAKELLDRLAQGAA